MCDLKHYRLSDCPLGVLDELLESNYPFECKKCMGAFEFDLLGGASVRKVKKVLYLAVEWGVDTLSQLEEIVEYAKRRNVSDGRDKKIDYQFGSIEVDGGIWDGLDEFFE
jgi:hypothetical protein